MASDNRAWVAANPLHWLAEHAGLRNLCTRGDFIDTCCLITAARLRDRLGTGWVLNDEMDLTLDVYQLSFGSDWDDSDHDAIVTSGQITQSFYMMYKERTVPFTQRHIRAALHGDYMHIAGFPSLIAPVNVYQWIPTNPTAALEVVDGDVGE